jgi:hypothetical protein
VGGLEVLEKPGHQDARRAALPVAVDGTAIQLGGEHGECEFPGSCVATLALHVLVFGEWTSNWEALSLWTAPGLFGPWQPLPGNPVLVDVRAARPGGVVVRAGERLVRPVQDCAGRYGAALGWAAIDRLDPDGLVQTVQRRDVPPPPLSGLHTFNRSGRTEARTRSGRVRRAPSRCRRLRAR